MATKTHPFIFPVLHAPRVVNFDLLSLRRDVGLERGIYELRLVDPFLAGERRIGIMKLLERARDKEAVVSSRLISLLLNNKQVIPAGWTRFSVVAAGTVWESKVRGLAVLRMWFDHRGWVADTLTERSMFTTESRILKVIKRT
ncbi:MAG TPA: hypothetical protein VD998_03435 [Verrucomicrobiae bacterium]|nr:hypothetical protein [Verrucomicrobiae bacterium]